MPFIALDEVSKFFGTAVALRKVTLEIQAGEAIALCGPNGAGKSTLLRCLVGLERPSSGSVHIGGYLLSKGAGFSAFRRRFRPGYAGAEHSLYADLSIRENLEFFSGLYPGTVSRARVVEMATQLGFEASLEKPVRHCSQGVRRRASLARALMHEPELLVLDEPLANLDEDGSARLVGVLSSLRARGVTLIVATHDPQFVRMSASRKLTLEAGRLCEDVRLSPNQQHRNDQEVCS